MITIEYSRVAAVISLQWIEYDIVIYIYIWFVSKMFSNFDQLFWICHVFSMFYLLQDDYVQYICIYIYIYMSNG